MHNFVRPFDIEFKFHDSLSPHHSACFEHSFLGTKTYNISCIF